MQYKQKTDAELVVLLTLNDEEAFSELYVRYKSKLQYFCFHFLKGEQLPEPDYYPIEKKWVHSTQQSTIPNINLYEIVEKCLNFK